MAVPREIVGEGYHVSTCWCGLLVRRSRSLPSYTPPFQRDYVSGRFFDDRRTHSFLQARLIKVNKLRRYLGWKQARLPFFLFLLFLNPKLACCNE